MGAFALPLFIASSVIGAAGQVMQGQAQASAYSAQAQIARNNAVLAQRNADVTMGEGEQATQRQQLKNRAAIGALTAEQAASGVDVNTGSAVDTKESAAELGQYDALTIRSNYARKAYGYRVEAQNDLNEAAMDKAAEKNSALGGYLGGFTSLLGSGASGFDKFGGGGSAGGSFGLGKGGEDEPFFW